jgi:hypothetical protein
MGPKTDLEDVERKNLVPTSTRTPTLWPSRPYPVAIPTALSRFVPYNKENFRYILLGPYTNMFTNIHVYISCTVLE